MSTVNPVNQEKPANYTSRFRENKITFLRVTNSEWIKFRSIRSNWITLALTFLVIVGFGILSASINRHRGGGAGEVRSPFDRVLTGVNLSVLIIAVFGGVFGAREYGSGMIKSSFSAVPRRLPVFFNKIILFSKAVFPTLLIAVFLAFMIGTSILKHNGTAVPKLGDPFILRALLGNIFYVLGLGLIGLSVGILVRQTAIAIGITVGGVLFLPALFGAVLPNSWHKALEYLPSNAGGAFTAPNGVSINSLSPTTGGIVFIAWIIGVFALTSFSLVKRDV